MAFDPHQIITDRVIGQLESGTPTWRMPWLNGLNVNYASGTVYRPLTQLLLGSAGFEDNYWLTPNQCKQAGFGFKGAKQIQIPTWYETKGKGNDARDGESAIIGSEDGPSGSGKTYWRMWLQPLFNAEQLQGMPPLEERAKTPPFSAIEVIDAMASKICEETGLKIQTGGQQAYYSPSLHTVKMPRKSLFITPLDYYMTLLHELVHSSMHPSMLGRDVHYVGEGRAKEELIAEFGSTFLAGSLHSSPSAMCLEQHAAYIQSWLSMLKADKTAIFTASKEASRICDYLARFAPNNELGAPSKPAAAPSLIVPASSAPMSMMPPRVREAVEALRSSARGPRVI
ncbi:ssDNA-binding domain-containing protein [Massilia sp. P8910]|uniref:ArdC family protein n=1 Tax=Massilia antarctica TaxID=2765360 RepID=UPI001E44885D|nr:zincin-like metallopeptidase domain-containing protein [Massilia antarctica]MCE3608059.1 ssDNA-binding domain-containing protein [Massilia antarctica]